MNIRLKKDSAFVWFINSFNRFTNNRNFPIVLFVSLLLISIGIFLIIKGSQTNTSSQGPRAYAVDTPITNSAINTDICRIANTNSNKIIVLGDQRSADTRFLPEAQKVTQNNAKLDFIVNQIGNSTSDYEKATSSSALTAIIAFGTNDCSSKDTNVFRDNLNKLKQDLINKRIIPIFLNIPAVDTSKVSCEQSVIEEYNKVIAQVAGIYPIVSSEKVVQISDLESDGISIKSSAYTNLTNAVRSAINQVANACNVSVDLDSATPASSALTPLSCSKAGINSATHYGSIPPSDFQRAASLGMGWVLAIAGHFDNFANFQCQDGVNLIIRPCAGEDCPLYDTNSAQFAQFAAHLKSMSCDVWLTGPNEPENEGVSIAKVNQIMQVYNTQFGDRNDNVHLLSPVHGSSNKPLTDPYFDSYKTQSWWNNIEGIAANAYNVNGSDAMSLFDSVIRSHGGNRDYYIVETGMLEVASPPGGNSIDRSTGLANLKSVFAKFNADASIKAYLNFNGFCLSPQADFAYGCLTDAEYTQVLSVDREQSATNACNGGEFNEITPGDGGGNGGSTDTFERSDVFGCCQYTDENAIKSCAVVPRDFNGTTEDDFDQVNAGVRMIPVSSTESPTQDASSKDWEYKYVITQQLHNFPLLQYLAAATKDRSQIEGTEAHTFMTDPGYDGQIIEYPNIDFTNQFEGVASIDDIDGNSVKFPVPSLGTAGAAGEYSREDYYEPLKLHCGLFYDKAGNLQTITQNLERNLLQETLAQTREQNNTLGLFEFLFGGGDQAQQISVQKWLESFLEQFKISAESAQKEAQFGEDVCVDQCGTGTLLSPKIQSCDYSDSVILPRDQFEMVIQGNAEDSVRLSPPQICNEMFNGSKVVGGTCNMQNGVSIDYFAKDNRISINEFCTYFNNPAKCSQYQQEAAQRLRTDADESRKDLYNQLVGQGINGDTISGAPYWTVSYPKSEDLKLQSILKAIENTYEMERRAFSEATITNPGDTEGRKICHYKNIGIDVQSTRTIWDAYSYVQETGFSNQGRELSPSSFWQNKVDGRLFHLPEDQIFKVSNEAGQYAQCGDVKSDNFNIFTQLGTLRNDRSYWGVAQNQPSEPQNIQGAPNSQATVSFIYPWVGQLPLMWQRISFWVSRGETTKYTITGQNVDNINQITNKSEEEKTIIPFCEDVPTENGVPTQDCLCSESTVDPLELYLRNNGMLQDSYVNNVPAPTNPDSGQCIYPGAGGGNGGPTPVDPGPDYSGSCEVGSLLDGAMYPVERIRIGTQVNSVHPGLDIGLDNGTPIVAAEDGEVIYVNYFLNRSEKYFNTETNIFDSNGAPMFPWFKAYGNVIGIRHSDGITLYAHLDPEANGALVTAGDCVTKGQLIGHSDDSGNSSGPHLHFEMRSAEFLSKATYGTNAAGNVYSFGGITYLNPSARPMAIVPYESFQNNGEGEGSGGGTGPEPVHPYCRDDEDGDGGGDDGDEGPIVSTGENEMTGMACLFKAVAEFTSKEENNGGIPWQFLWAINYQETKGRCTPSHQLWYGNAWNRYNWYNWQINLHSPWIQSDGNNGYNYIGKESVGIGNSPDGRNVFAFRDNCSGDPNQIGMYADGNGVAPQVRGIMQFSKNTFEAILKNIYWDDYLYGSPGPMNTTDFMQACTEFLNIDRNNQESREDSGFYSGVLMTTQTDKYSRLRVGDSVCASAAMLSELAAAYNGGEAVPPNLWSKNISDSAAGPYHGNCSLGYCESTWNWMGFAKGYFDESKDDACKEFDFYNELF